MIGTILVSKRWIVSTTIPAVSPPISHIPNNGVFNADFLFWLVYKPCQNNESSCNARSNWVSK